MVGNAGNGTVRRTGINPATGLAWAPAADGLRNTGRRRNVAYFRGSDRHLASGGAANFPGDIAGFVAGKEDEDGGDLGGLRGTPEDSIGAPIACLLPISNKKRSNRMV